MAQGLDEQLPWTGLLKAADVSTRHCLPVRCSTSLLTSLLSSLTPRSKLVRLKEAVPSFLICPEFTGRFGAADEAGVVKVMGSSTDYYLAKKILSKWHAKATQQPSEKVKWWLAFVEEKGIKPVRVSELPRWYYPVCCPQLITSFRPPRSPTTSSTASPTSAGWTTSPSTTGLSLRAYRRRTTPARKLLLSRRRSAIMARRAGWWGWAELVLRPRAPERRRRRRRVDWVWLWWPWWLGRFVLGELREHTRTTSSLAAAGVRSICPTRGSRATHPCSRCLTALAA